MIAAYPIRVYVCLMYDIVGVQFLSSLSLEIQGHLIFSFLSRFLNKVSAELH